MELYKEFEKEIELLPMVLLLEEYRIPYEQQEGKLLIPNKFTKKVDALLSEEASRKQEFLHFARFETKVLLSNMVDLLKHHEIPFQVHEQKTAIDEVYVQNPMAIFYSISIQAGDFEKVNALLKKSAEEQQIYKDADYYLRTLNDRELLEILEKPDDWNVVDVVGARFLLKERGFAYSDEDVELMRLHRLIELSRPQVASKRELIIAWILSFLIPPVGIFQGIYYFNEKTILPNGRKVNTFDAATRRQGLRFLQIGIVLTLIMLVLLIMNNALVI